MKVAHLIRLSCAPLIVLAATAVQGCELRPSRLFVPPAHMSAGPPSRALTPSTAEAVVEAEPPKPPPLEWRDAPEEPVIVRRLDSGIPMHGIVRPEVATATVLVVLGTKKIPTPSATAQIYMDAALRSRSTTPHLDGANVFTFRSDDFVAIGVTALAPVLESALSELLPEMFDALLLRDHVDTAKTSLVNGLVGFEPGRRATAALLGSLFPVPHPYGFAAAATIPDHFRAVKTADVHAFRDAHVTADNMMVTAAGNLDAESLAATMSRVLAKAPRHRLKEEPTPSVAPSCAGRALMVADPVSTQAVLAMAYPAVPAKHPDAAPLAVVAAALGGSLSTRLNVSLRREHASGPFGAQMNAMRAGGTFVLQGNAEPPHTSHALISVSNEIDALIRTPLGDEDLLLAKLTAAHTTSRLGGVSTAVRLAQSAILGTSSFDASAIKGVTAEQVRAAAERYLSAAKRCVVAVGDPAVLEPQLRSAGVGPVSRAPW